MYPLEFLDELFIAKIRIPLGLSVGEDFVILACVILTQCQGVTDRRTDRQTDNPTVANTGLCTVSYVDALKNGAKWGKGLSDFDPNESVLTFRAPNFCAKFHQN